MNGVSELVAFGAAAVSSGLLASTCGNASSRIEPDTMLITRSGATLGALTEEDIVVVRISDGRVMHGVRPSMEVDIHRRAFIARPQANAVLHCQSRRATLLACMADPPENLDLIPEVPAYVGRHAYAPYARPGSEDLADGVLEALTDPQVTVVQMISHGQVIVGRDWREVIRRGTFFEVACDIAASGLSLRTIPESEAAVLRGPGAV